MSRPLVLAALSVLTAPTSVLAAPAAAQAQPAYYYKTALLKNISPAAILATLHWNTQNSVLPQGIRRIYALQSSHRLLIEGIPDGYQRVKALVASLDVPAPKPQQK